MARLVVGTRGSALARWQTAYISDRLRAEQPELEIEQRVIRTEGDLQQERPLGRGDVGAFVRTIEQALRDETIDFAVHSLKDMPTEQSEGLVLAAVPRRHDCRDALLSPEGWTLAQLPDGARVGTCSPRRQAQLLHARPDLRIEPLRGNVDTRIRQLEQGRFEAIVLALAGVERLGIEGVPVQPLSVEECLPAPGQGALALESRAGDRCVLDVVPALEDLPTRVAVDCERSFLGRLGAGCLAAVGAHGVITSDGLRLEGMIAEPQGRQLMRDTVEGDRGDAKRLAIALADRMLAAGGDRLLALADSDG